MLGCLRGVVVKGVALLALLAAAYAGWLWGPAVFPRIQGWLGMEGSVGVEAPEPSQEVADSVVARVQALREAQGGRLALGGREITSVIRYAFPGLLPPGVKEPTVIMKEGRLFLQARVVQKDFPRLPDLGPFVGILPDTLNVELEASLMPFGPEEAALLVQRVETSRVPLPRRLIPDILSAIGRVDRPGLPPEAMVVPLPSGLNAAHIVADSLIISSQS